jgi:hypothetical protein
MIIFIDSYEYLVRIFLIYFEFATEVPFIL